MNKIAFLYAGQGSQETGMGQQFYEDYPEFRAIFDGACLDFDLKEACFVNPNNMLKQTRYTQPCMTAFACGVTEILKKREIKADYVCGLSLGEYSALYSAGVWSLQDTLKIVSRRGQAMEEASEGIESAMCAILGLDLAQIETCCEEASQDGLVSVCNMNCPGQIVIGGERKAVSAASHLAREHGARRCIPLQVSGPFHTAFMQPAADALKDIFAEITFHTPTISVLYNVLGGPNALEAEIGDLLVQQVKSPVKMQMCIEYLFNNGVDTFIEIGPGNALQGFVKKTASYMNIDQDCYYVLSVNQPKDIPEAL